MSLPEPVEAALGGETPTARANLGGEDQLVVTPTRTVVYRAEGLLSGESVEEFPHDAERIEFTEGRRKTKLTLDYGLDGERTFALPVKRVEDVLKYVVGGVFAAVGIIEADESVERVFRFSELTLVVTSARVIRHIGSAVWDEDFEEYRYDDVTDLAFERGSVATAVVMALGDRQERFKTPNDSARAVREAIESALFARRGVETVEELRADGVDDGDGDSDGDASNGDDRADKLSFGEGPDPLSPEPADLSESPTNVTQPAEEAAPEPERTTADTSAVGSESPLQDTATAGEGVSSAAGTEHADSDFQESGFEPAGPVDDVASELAALREAVEAQGERIRRQEALVEQLVEELRRGR